ncbi:MAG TPA: trypsin-like peptidase domain-containing protein [Chitinophagaceae bacterium]|jgi:trypsin-like peptidase|nr:trypsin-like peptidase domain-containing protein [Chitinophagaceae bacterium]
MFKTAIEKVGGFTRAIHFISNTYGEKEILPGAATLFFVNEDAVAVTCKHVSSLMRQTGEITKRYSDFVEEKKQLTRSGSYNKKLKELKEAYGYDKVGIDCQLLYQLVDCVDQVTTIDIAEHPTADLAILKLKGFTNKKYEGYAVFAKNSNELQPGLFLCRLGYPFPEFSNFTYNEEEEKIGWSSQPAKVVRFPIDGMVTRHIASADGKISGIELSSPGLRGQSGGPLFNEQGLIFGMQNMTNHLHLGFDMKNREIISGGKKLRVTNQPFLHVGVCIHLDIIKEFLSSNGVKYYEE